MQLRNYQEKAVNEVAIKLASGIRKVVFQLATGGGKTVVFSAIAHRYTTKSPKSVLILVHRKELLVQTRRTLYAAFGIAAQAIEAGMRTVPTASVYVGMVESVARRIPKNIGLVIIDEAHIAAFNKIHEYFPEQFIIGFTATPKSASKKHPMKDFYQDIVCGIDIPELIEQKNLCQNITFSPKDSIDRSMLAMKGGDFDEAKMASEFAAPKFINNTVKAYAKWAAGTKCVIFNCTIDHAIQVNNAFIIAGYNARHLDSSMTSTERSSILQWFKTTPGAILNNVAILTAGWDEPTIETVIFNKATMSMPLFLQCTGRGARPTDEKSAFTIIDMGGNALVHGDWCDSRDWEDIFRNPLKNKKTDGVAPCKNCPECDAIVPASTRNCKHCGCLFPEKPPAIEEELSDFIMITKGIDVLGIIAANKEKKEYYPFYLIGKNLAIQAKRSVPSMSDERAEFILTTYNTMAKTWCNALGKKYNQWHQARAKEHLYLELAEQFKKWKNPMDAPTTITA